MTVHVAAAMIGIAWTAPTLISFLPIFLGWYTTEDHIKWRKDPVNSNICMLKPNVPYAILSSTLTFWLPVSVMLIMYRRVYKEAQRQKVSIFITVLFYSFTKCGFKYTFYIKSVCFYRWPCNVHRFVSNNAQITILYYKTRMLSRDEYYIKYKT